MEGPGCCQLSYPLTLIFHILIYVLLMSGISNQYRNMLYDPIDINSSFLFLLRVCDNVVLDVL